MMNFNDYAYSSQLKNVAASHKLLFSMVTLCISLWADSLPTSLLILLLMSWHTLCKSGIGAKIYFKMLRIPLSFLLMSVVMVAIPFTPLTIYKAFHLFFKSFAALSCLYYLSLTTPLTTLLSTLAKLKVPTLFIELMLLMYRFIFIVLETCHQMMLAQKVRLGYSSYRSSFRCFGSLFATLFIRAFEKANAVYTALEARGHDGELKVLDVPVEDDSREYLFFCLGHLFFIIVFTVFAKRLQGGFLT
jgi:cobalt/nickel transport system permease protein